VNLNAIAPEDILRIEQESRCSYARTKGIDGERGLDTCEETGKTCLLEDGGTCDIWDENEGRS